MKTAFRGVFLTSDTPVATADFYRDVAGFPVECIDTGGYRYWQLDRDGMQFAIHEAGAFADYSSPPVATSNLTHLYFKIDDHAAFLEHIGALGIEPHATDDVVVTIIDPDGRKVLFGTA